MTFTVSIYTKKGIMWYYNDMKKKPARLIYKIYANLKREKKRNP